MRKLIFMVLLISMFVSSKAEIDEPCSTRFNSEFFFADSLPPLHLIKETDIAAVTSSFEMNTITVTLKNGIIYSYGHEDWDFEDYYPSLCKKLRQAINDVKITYTKVQHPPEFPGGLDAWDEYIQKFNEQHAWQIEKNGPTTFEVQFIVHLKGQITDLGVIRGPDNELQKLAIQAMKNTPPWIPATQNGYKVVSYMTWKINMCLLQPEEKKK
ncbi:MAG: energy transducer TonB [Bacteroidetes bacterium]|nr:energy transducer TonB [Bacteroidota bacterium]